AFDETSPTGEQQRLAGNTFRLTPKHSASAGLGVQGDAGFGEWFLRPAYTWKSRVYFEEQWQQESFLHGEAPGLYQEPYGLLNLRAGLTALDGATTIELWGTNLLDTRYVIDAGNTGLVFYAPTYIAGPPLLFGLRVTARL
ncbi:MAG: TonB-dependent receptor, partial [Longimicrobiales bacterium]|nr:TonB-dependent receptor [Longimicrobiales bacterium]